MPPAARWGHLETLWRMRGVRRDAIIFEAFARRVKYFDRY